MNPPSHVRTARIVGADGVALRPAFEPARLVHPEHADAIRLAGEARRDRESAEAALKAAHEEAERIRSAAHEQGLAEGRRAAARELEERVDTLADSLQRSLADLRTEVVERTTPLVVELARGILRRELVADGAILVDRLRDALDRFEDGLEIIVRAHEDVVDALERAWSARRDRDRTHVVRFLADPDAGVARIELRASSGAGQLIDLERELDRIGDAFGRADTGDGS